MTSDFRRIAFPVCAVAWTVAFLLQATPAIMSGDEPLALFANSIDGSEEFLATTNSAERWAYLEEKGQGGKPLWTAAHLALARLLPGPQTTAQWVPLLSSLATALAIAGAARNLFGRTAGLLALLLASLSPLVLYFSVRLLAITPAVAWTAIALWAFSFPARSRLAPLAGGLCFGLAFATHYAAGTAIVALAGGLVASAARRVLRARGRRLPALAGEVARLTLGAAGAIAPLVALEAWARHAGSSYFARLLAHENLAVPYLGPYGLWLRLAFELDPLFQMVAIAAVLRAIGSREFGRVERVALYFGGVSAAGLVASSLAFSTPRAGVSVAIFSLAGAIGFVLARGARPAPFVASDSAARDPFLSSFGLFVAAVAGFALLSRFRALGGMPRLVFPLWPIALVGLAGLAMRAFRDRPAFLFRGVAALGLPLCLVAARALHEARTVEPRHLAAKSRLDLRESFYFLDFLNEHRYETFAARASDRMHVAKAPSIVFPTVAYEEEPFKRANLAVLLHRHGADRFFSADELVNACVAFDFPDPSGRRRPPPEAPFVPANAVLIRPGDAGYASPRIHPHRGLEAAFPPAPRGERETRGFAFRLRPPDAEGDPVFGFEYLAVAPFAPPATAIDLRIVVGDRELALFPIRPSEAEVPFAALEFPVAREAIASGTVRVEATLSSEPGRYRPPATLHLRRAYVAAGRGDARFFADPRDEAGAPLRDDAPRPLRAGEWSAPEILGDYPWPRGSAPCATADSTGLPMPMALARAGGDPARSLLRAETLPDGRSSVEFLASLDGDAARYVLFAEGTALLEFAHPANDAVWRAGDVELAFDFAGRDSGTHGRFRLTTTRLPPRPDAEGEPSLAISVRTLSSGHAGEWFAFRSCGDGAANAAQAREGG